MPMWFGNLVFWSAQVALLVVAAAILPRLFQIRQPRVLLVYWRALLALSIFLPVLEPWRRLALRLEVDNLGALPNLRALPPPTAGIARWMLSTQDVAWIVGGVIGVGIVLRFALFIVGVRRLRKFRDRSTPISVASQAGELLGVMRARLGCHGEFRWSVDVESPVTFGWRKPTILLPEEFLRMEPQLQGAIACHE